MAFTKATYDYLDSGGLINWQLTAKTANFPAVSGEGYLVDTSSAAITVTLPTSPSAGDEIIIVDYASNAGTNNITLDPGTLNLRGATDDLVLSTNNQTARLLYSGATKGWLVTTEAGAGAAAAAVPDLTVDYLVIAGGGSGGAPNAGGGGAGGLRTSYSNTSSLNGHTEASLSLSTATNYTVTIGSGASGITGYNHGLIGSNSVFSTIAATGGGGGGYYLTPAGDNGGSGGGSQGSTGGAAVTSPVTQGFAGGSGPGGGGGGASAVGGNGNNTTGAAGGAGLAVNILSSTNAAPISVGEVSGGNVYYAGGGGGSGNSNGLAGGIGGGGNGTGGGGTATSGDPNTGGGGGAAHTSYPSGSGGSGVVILRYPSEYAITVGSGITEASGSPFTESTEKSISIHRRNRNNNICRGIKHK